MPRPPGLEGWDTLARARAHLSPAACVFPGAAPASTPQSSSPHAKHDTKAYAKAWRLVFSTSVAQRGPVLGASSVRGPPEEPGLGLASAACFLWDGEPGMRRCCVTPAGAADGCWAARRQLQPKNL